MSKFIVQMVNAYTREVLDTEDDIFDNEQDAEAYARECGGAFAEGAEVLDLAGKAGTTMYRLSGDQPFPAGQSSWRTS